MVVNKNAYVKITEYLVYCWMFANILYFFSFCIREIEMFSFFFLFNNRRIDPIIVGLYFLSPKLVLQCCQPKTASTIGGFKHKYHYNCNFFWNFKITFKTYDMIWTSCARTHNTSVLRIECYDQFRPHSRKRTIVYVKMYNLILRELISANVRVKSTDWCVGSIFNHL